MTSTTPSSGIPKLIRETLNVWAWPFHDTACAYARGVAQGQCQPISSLSDVPKVAVALDHPIPGDRRSGTDDFTTEEWEAGISGVHGLAAGEVWCEETGEAFTTAEKLADPVQIYEQDLRACGLRLHDVARAFSGDVHAAAVAIMKGFDRDDERQTE